MLVATIIKVCNSNGETQTVFFYNIKHNLSSHHIVIAGQQYMYSNNYIWHKNYKLSCSLMLVSLFSEQKINTVNQEQPCMW